MGLFKKKPAGNEVRLKVTGMTCPHCEMRVKNALNGVNGANGAKADHTSDSATVLAEDGVDAGTLIGAVEEAGYHAEPMA